MCRCIDSILAQPLPFEYEIIISDDASTDGTWEVAQEYAKCYPQIRAIQCNTDDYHPVNRCQRCGWNQCNAYRHSCGKYFAHVDADDFFCEGTEVLMKQVDLLESHPRCSCCMANSFRLGEGEEATDALLDNPHAYDNGYVLSSEDYIANYWKIDHAFVYRRYVHEDPTVLFGGYYDDTLITDYHVQFGDIVCLDDAGYVYVQYKDSIWNEVMASKDSVALCSIIIIPALIPIWKDLFYGTRNQLCQLLGVVKMLLLGHKLQEGNLAYLKGLPYRNRLVGMMNRDLSLWEKMFLALLVIDLKLMKYVPLRPLYWLPSKVWIEQ